MSIFFNKVQRGRPGFPGLPKKWFVSFKSIGMMDEKEVSRLLAEGTTLNPKEAELAFYQFEKILVQALLDGKTVKMGDMGTFQVVAKSRGVDNEEDVNAKLVDKITVNFEASKGLKRKLQKASLISLDTFVERRERPKAKSSEEDGEIDSEV